MSRIIRTVSLSKKTDELASQKGNFSAWVREQLILDHQNVSFLHVTKSIFEEKGICNPFAYPYCGICYPYGKPKAEDGRLYNSGHIDKEVLYERTKNHYDGVIPIIQETPEEKAPLPPPKREKKYVRRFLKWLIEWI